MGGSFVLVEVFHLVDILFLRIMVWVDASSPEDWGVEACAA